MNFKADDGGVRVRHKENAREIRERSRKLEGLILRECESLVFQFRIVSEVN